MRRDKDEDAAAGKGQRYRRKELKRRGWSSDMIDQYLTPQGDRKAGVYFLASEVEEKERMQEVSEALEKIFWRRASLRVYVILGIVIAAPLVIGSLYKALGGDLSRTAEVNSLFRILWIVLSLKILDRSRHCKENDL